jgi:mono/diheme cytochrome c family protein
VIKDPSAYAQRNGKAGSDKVDSNALIGWGLVEASVLNTCMNCHVGKSAPELGSYSAVVQNLIKIQTATGSNAMPPAKNGYQVLSDCQKAILKAWASQNSPDLGTQKVSELPECKSNGNIGNAPLPPLSQTVLTYENVLSRVLQRRCINCHNPDSKDVEAAGVLFYPYAEITKRKTLWGAPGATSKLVHMLTRQDEDRMPPVEESALADDEINFITRWIDAGKPEK